MDWSKIEPEIAKAIIDAAAATAKWIWKRATGSNNEDAEEAIKRKIVEAALHAANLETEQLFAAGVDLGIALERMSRNASDVIVAIERAAKSPTIPPLEVDVEIVKPLPPDPEG